MQFTLSHNRGTAQSVQNTAQETHQPASHSCTPKRLFKLIGTGIIGALAWQSSQSACRGWPSATRTPANHQFRDPRTFRSPAPGLKNPADLQKIEPVSNVTASTHVTASSPPAEHPDGQTPAPDQPPFKGTVWVNSHIYQPGDPSRYVGVTYEGQSDQTMEVFHGDTPNTDWHVETVHNAYCFQLQVSPQQTVRVHVAPDFGTQTAAQAEVERYGKMIGQMPSFLRKGLEQIDIHRDGNHTFSANGHRHSVLIYKEANDRMFGETQAPHLEEALFHELTHAAVEADHIHRSAYAEAMAADGIAISTYAADKPAQEDLSESLLMIYASLHRPDRLSADQQARIRETIPHRMAYAQQHIIKHPHLRGGDV